VQANLRVLQDLQTLVTRQDELADDRSGPHAMPAVPPSCTEPAKAASKLLIKQAANVDGQDQALLLRHRGICMTCYDCGMQTSLSAPVQ